MKGVLSFLGFAAAAATAGTIVYLYMNDRAVKEKVDIAIGSVANAVTEIKQSFETTVAKKQKEQADAMERNRAWVDEQWDALGI